MLWIGGNLTATDDSTNLITIANFNGTITTSAAAPVWTAPGDQSRAYGDAVSLQVSAGDALNNPLSYSATGWPLGLNIDSTNGLISGTISAGADTSSPYAVTVTATDSAGLSASQSFNWNVAPVGLANPGPQASVDDQAVSLQLQGSSGATYTATGLPISDYRRGVQGRSLLGMGWLRTSLCAVVGVGSHLRSAGGAGRFRVHVQRGSR